jgi:adenylate cyclase
MTAIGSTFSRIAGGNAAGQSPGSPRISSVFLKEEQKRKKMAFRARSVSLAVIALWIMWLIPFRDALFYLPLLGMFVLTGYGHYWVTTNRPFQLWPRLALIVIDFGLLAFTTLTDNPLNDWIMPAPLRLESGNLGYFLIVLIGVGLSYSAQRMIISGIIAGLAWAAGYIWVAMQPGAFTYFDREMLTTADWIAAHADPMFVDLHVLYQDLIILGIITGVLALTVRGSRRLVLEQVQVARERQNLARYFAPNMVDSLAERDEPLGPVRAQDVAVLFADVVGFTRWAEGKEPGAVIGLLREVHRRLGDAVFEHGGTLDKFMGDGLMATFGTPDTGTEDAVNAIAAAVAMQEAMATFNAEHACDAPVCIAVGVHFGPVVLGDIGSAQRMEFAVLGDAVNVASRLERATRETGCGVLVSAAAVDAARRQNSGRTETMLAGAQFYDGIEVPGHRAVPAFALG